MRQSVLIHNLSKFLQTNHPFSRNFTSSRDTQFFETKKVYVDCRECKIYRLYIVYLRFACCLQLLTTIQSKKSDFSRQLFRKFSNLVYMLKHRQKFSNRHNSVANADIFLSVVCWIPPTISYNSRYYL